MQANSSTIARWSTHPLTLKRANWTENNYEDFLTVCSTVQYSRVMTPCKWTCTVEATEGVIAPLKHSAKLRIGRPLESGNETRIISQGG